MLFGKSKLYERMLADKQQEIDWLRAQLGTTAPGYRPLPLPPKPATAIADGEPAVIDDGGWVSEEDEAKKIVEAHGLSAVHLPEILSGLGYGDSELM